MSLRFCWILAPLLVGLIVPAALAQQSADRAAAEEAIHAAANAYVQALAAGDSQTMLGMWAEGGDIINALGIARPASELIPRQAAAQVAAAGNGQVADPPQISDKSIRFLTDDVAIEDGRIEANGPLGSRSGRFTAIWVRQEGTWRLASIREIRLEQNSAALLGDLDWMVGTWRGEAGGATFEVSAHWNEKHTLLFRDLAISIDGKKVVDAQQRVGFDPADGLIRSWMHDHDGGHGEGLWTKHGDAWVVQATGVMPDGRRTTGTNIYRHDGPDKFTWKSIGSTSAGQTMPDFEIELQRTKPAPTEK